MLAVIMQKTKSFSGDAIDVGRFVAHYSVAIGAEVGDPDVVTEDDENVWFLLLFFLIGQNFSPWLLVLPVYVG